MSLLMPEASVRTRYFSASLEASVANELLNFVFSVQVADFLGGGRGGLRYSGCNCIKRLGLLAVSVRLRCEESVWVIAPQADRCAFVIGAKRKVSG